MDRDTADSESDAFRPTARSIHDAVRSGVGRRGFLKALIAAGLGAGLARWLSVDDVLSTDRGEVPIVYGFVRSDPEDPRSIEPRKKTVPADWFDELKRAFDVHRTLPVTELTGFVGSSVVPGNPSDPRASITIQSTAESVRDEVSELFRDVKSDVEFGDVKFDVDVLEDLPDPTGETSVVHPKIVADPDERSVPAGVFCGNEEVRGSLASALYDESTGERFFATANHLYGGDGRDHRGDPLYLYGENDRARVGRVRRGYLDEDVVLADPVDGYVPESEISDASPGTVAGQFTKLGLADLMARGEPLAMTAAMSGHTSGEIEGIDGITFYTGDVVRTGQLLWGDESTFTDGDSGSINYHPDPENDDQVLVGGVNSARTWWPGADFTWGTAAYQIRDAHGFVF